MSFMQKQTQTDYDNDKSPYTSPRTNKRPTQDREGGTPPKATRLHNTCCTCDEALRPTDTVHHCDGNDGKRHCQRYFHTGCGTRATSSSAASSSDSAQCTLCELQDGSDRLFSCNQCGAVVHYDDTPVYPVSTTCGKYFCPPCRLMHLCENLVDVNPTQRVRIGPSGELLTPRGDRMQDTDDLIPTFGGSRAFEDAGSNSGDRGDPIARASHSATLLPESSVAAGSCPSADTF